MTLDQYKNFINSKNVAVVGIGVSNLPLIDFLIKCGANVTACDKKERAEIEDTARILENKGVNLKLGEDYLKELKFDIIFKSPGIRPDIPEFETARKNGTQVTSEMELFFELCPCKKIAITGSDGKTTTTTLICKILEEAGYKCHLGGNIGRPLIGDIEQIKPGDIAVLELSSFQLFTMTDSPEIAVITNVEPNHLDWHKSFDEYKISKENIYKYQTANDLLVLNLDNKNTREMFDRCLSKGRFFSRLKEPDEGAFQSDGEIFMKTGGRTVKIMNESDIKIPGKHNVENYLAATAAVFELVSPEHIKKVAQEFGGVEHRIEFVREVNGIKFYNDSIASSPTRTIAALNSFEDELILIAGGYDKKIPFDELGIRINEKVKELVLVGHTAEKIKEAAESAGNNTSITICEDFEQAVMTAYEKAKPGDKVVLSPACASFDLFKDFMVRGETFKDIVNNI